LQNLNFSGENFVLFSPEILADKPYSNLFQWKESKETPKDLIHFDFTKECTPNKRFKNKRLYLKTSEKIKEILIDEFYSSKKSNTKSATIRIQKSEFDGTTWRN